MTLEQLRIFIAVAERQHVTDAAAALGLTQSAASAAIAALESRYDVKLFHRVGRGITLSEEGALFLKEAKAVLRQAAAAETALLDLGKVLRGRLHVWASQTVGTYWLPRRLLDFHERFPGVMLDAHIDNTEHVAAAVRDGAAQLGFVEGEVHDGALNTKVVAHDRLLLVVGQGHPWAGRKAPLKPSHLAGSKWVLREQGSGTRAAFDQLLTRHKLAQPEIVLELPSNEAIAIAVEAGGAATILSASAVVAGLEAELLYAVPFELPERNYTLLTSKAHGLSRSAEAFLETITPVKTKRVRR